MRAQLSEPIDQGLTLPPGLGEACFPGVIELLNFPLLDVLVAYASHAAAQAFHFAVVLRVLLTLNSGKPLDAIDQGSRIAADHRVGL